MAAPQFPPAVLDLLVLLLGQFPAETNRTFQNLFVYVQWTNADVIILRDSRASVDH